RIIMDTAMQRYELGGRDSAKDGEINDATQLKPNIQIKSVDDATYFSGGLYKNLRTQVAQKEDELGANLTKIRKDQTFVEWANRHPVEYDNYLADRMASRAGKLYGLTKEE